MIKQINTSQITQRGSQQQRTQLLIQWQTLQFWNYLRREKGHQSSDINSETSSCEGLYILKWLVCRKQFSHNSVIILYLYVLNRWYELEAVRKWSEAIWSEVKKCPTAQTSYIPWLACFNFDVELWTC